METSKPLNNSRESSDLIDELLAEHPFSTRSQSSTSQVDVGNIIPHESDLIHPYSPTFLQLYLLFWQEYGFFCQSGTRMIIESDPLNIQSPLPPELFDMAQKARFRILQIIHYLRFLQVRRSEVTPKRTKLQAGQHKDGLVVTKMLRSMYPDWDEVDSYMRNERRQRYYKENRQAKRWLMTTSKLSFGVLLLCNKQVESKVINTHLPDSTLVFFLEQIAGRYPYAISVLRLLDETVRGVIRSFLSFECAAPSLDINLVITSTKRILGYKMKMLEDELPFPPRNYLFENDATNV